MKFTDLLFLLYFLPALLLIYYIVPRKAKNTVLFIAGIVFYAFSYPAYAILLLVSTAFNFASGLILSKTAHRKTALTLNIIINLGILLTFRYPGILMPLGISFYTLRALSYAIDVYRKTTPVAHNFIDFGLYMSFFGLMPAGPIVRYNDAVRQLTLRRSTGTRFLDGMSCFSAGLCKKAVIADSLYPLYTTIAQYDLTGLSASHAWLGIIAFVLWVYFAFSGCCDMAVGLGKMFGFEFPQNFRYPYAAKSISAFCSRFNISLIKWFKEYVYTPKKSLPKSSLSLILMWVLIGMWYGIGIGTVLWGICMAVFIILEKIALKKILPKIGILANIYTLFIIIIGFVPFMLADFSDIILYIKAMFTGYGGFSEQDFMYNLTSYAGTIITAIIIALGLPRKIRFINHDAVRYIFAAAGFILAVAYI